MNGRAQCGPPKNKLGRRQHDLLLDLGYELVGRTGGGHLVYDHPDGRRQIISGTSYDRTAWQAFVSDLRSRHPESDHPVLRQRKSLRPRRQYRRRVARAPLSLLSVPAPPADAVVEDPHDEVPPPGSSGAVAAGCWCPVYENRKGLGLEGRDGVYAYVVGCPVHQDESREAA